MTEHKSITVARSHIASGEPIQAEDLQSLVDYAVTKHKEACYEKLRVRRMSERNIYHNKDLARMDWLADVENVDAYVGLPKAATDKHPTDLRKAIDFCMKKKV